jgi:hypothetical protein
MNKFLPVIFAAGALAAVTPAQVTKSGAGYLLRVKYAPGQVIKLTSTNKMVNATTGKAVETSIILPVLLRITGVKAGLAQARMVVGPATYNGQPLIPSKTVVMSLNSRNQATNVQGGASSVGATLPEKPIKVGQTWKALAPISTGTGGVQKVEAIYKFVGVKSVNGQGVAVVTYTISGGVGKGSGRMTILQKDGTLWTNDLKMDVRAGTTPVTVTSAMKRV